MTDLTQKHRESRTAAINFRRQGQYVSAGDWYTLAAYTDLATGKPGNSSAAELRHFIEAATCYRVGGHKDRCENRCHMGILRAEDLRERYKDGSPPSHSVHHATRGGWDEFIGDLRVVGDLGGVAQAYERALTTYREAGDPEAYRAESPNSVLWAYFDDIERGATGDAGSISHRQTVTFSEFLQYKRKHLPTYIRTLVEQGEWSVPNPERSGNS